MPVLGPGRTVARIRILVFAVAALGLLLLWGSWLIYGAGIGTQICENYTRGAVNPLLSQWCSGNSWRGWLAACLAIAATLFGACVALALTTAQAAWLIPGTLLSAVALWAGFAIPQEVAAASPAAAPPSPSVAPPQPYQPPPVAPTLPGPSPLERRAPAHLPRARPRGLAGDIIPAPLFGCPRGPGALESASGPGAITNFDTVRVERGPGGLCASFTSAEIATFALHQDETRVVSLTFMPHVSSRSSSTPSPRSFSVEVWAANDGRTYSLVLRPSDGAVQSVTVGNLGLARGHLSILIDQPRLPSWILDRQSSWSAQLT